MEEFNGLSRDTTRDKNPVGTWEFARNMLMSKGISSLTNEEGFDYKHDIPGQIIGRIETNEEVIYFSIDGSFSCIGLYKTNEEPAVYIPILRTIYLGFKINRPIEGIFFYNFNKELIIGFCDGVFEDSNTPKLINCTNIGISLDINLELINPNDTNKLELSANLISGDISISYLSNGSLEAEVVYITYAYIYPDNITATPFLPIRDVAYPITKFRQEDKRSIQINLSNLDIAYNKLKIGVLIKVGETLFGYESNIRSYIGDTYTTILSSFSSYTSISPEALLIPTIIYKRVKTMTTVNSEVIIGNLVTTEIIPFQKYANLLKLGLRFDTRLAEKQADPILCPDEVYSFTIALHNLDGTYSEEFHIVGEEANPINNETDILSPADLTALGLTDLGIVESFKRFRIFNTGGFNTLSLGVNSPFDSDAILNWGYWENEETYPNDNNYNSLIDYEGNPIIGGVDLRGTPIRYHRVPGLDNLVKGFPCTLGHDNMNTEYLVGSTFRGALPAFAVFVENFDTIVPNSIKNKIQGYKISIVKRVRGESLIEDINFLKQARIIPRTTDEVKFIDTYYDKAVNRTNTADVDEIHQYSFAQFGYSKIRSMNLAIFKPEVSATLIKANYAVDESKVYHQYGTTAGDRRLPVDTTKATFTVGNIGYTDFNTLQPSYFLIPDTQRFAVLKELTYLPGNNVAANTRTIEETILLNANNTLALSDPSSSAPPILTRWNPLLMVIPDDPYGSHTLTLQGFIPDIGYSPYIFSDTTRMFSLGISSTIINLHRNVYSGFSATEFITIGYVSTLPENITIDLPLLRDGGDVFTNNLHATIISITNTSSSGLIRLMTYAQVLIKGMIGITNNSEVYTLLDRLVYGSYDLSDPEVDTFDYTNHIYDKPSTRSLNDLLTGLSFDINRIRVNYFPYRLHRSLKIANENLSLANVRTFLANDYKEMLNDRGEIIALRGSNKTLYIQQKFSLFIATIKDKITTADSVTYLGEGELFDRTPDEVLDASNKGYFGSTSQFGCILFRDGYVGEDQVKGKIFIVGRGGVKEISKDLMNNWFANNWEIDNKYFRMRL